MLMFCSISGQQVIYIKQDATGNSDGSSWDDAFTDLQQALSSSEEGDELWIAQGTYFPTADADRSASFHMKSGQKWYGGFVGFEDNEKQRRISRNPTVLSGNIGNISSSSDNSFTVVKAIDVDTSTLMNGIDIVDGYANGSTGSDIYDPEGNAGGMFIGIENIPLGGVKLEQVDFLRNYANGYGAAMMITGRNESKALMHIDICFYYSNKAGKDANLIYAEELAEGIQHKILDTQIRSGEIASSASEIILNMSGSKQELLFKSNISGNIISAGQNRFLEINNYADQLILDMVDNQLYSSHLDRGFEIINHGGDIFLDFKENDVLDLTHISGEEDYVINFINKSGGQIHANVIENDFIRNHVTSLINGSELSSLRMESNLMMRNRLIGSAVMLKGTDRPLPDVITANGVFTYNEGPLYLLDQNGQPTGEWQLTNCTFYSNFTQTTDNGFLGTDTKALIYFFLNGPSLQGINNSVFYHENGGNQPLVYMNGGTLDFNHNLVQFNQCDGTIIREGNATFNCNETVVNSNPIVLSSSGRNVRLASCSPAINIGNATYAIAAGIDMDYRNGGPRIQGNQIDAGAVEHKVYTEDEKRLCTAFGDKIELPDFGEAPYEYTWTNHTGNQGSGISSLEAGYYYITITDKIGCPLNVELNIYEEGGFNLLNHDIQRGITFCNGSSVTLEAPPHYQVIWPDGSNGPSYTTAETGSVTLQVSNDCITEDYEIELWAYTPQFNQSYITLCDDDVLTLSSQLVSNSGTYMDTLQNLIGCDSIITEYIVERSEREEVAIDGDLTICEYEESLVHIIGGDQFLWENGSNESSQWLTPGNHYARVIDENGCTHELSFNIDTYVSQDWISDTLIIKPPSQSVMVEINNPAGRITDIVPKPDGVSHTDREITFNNNTSEVYKVYIQYGNGCVDEEVIKIEVPFDEENLIQVSNVLSTTSDQRMKIYADPAVEIYSLKVFDRWGQKVYDQSTGWDNTVSFGWDGNIGSTRVPPGVYVWLMEYSYDGNNHTLTGDITIIQ
jgi:hypothetical protein